MAPRTASSAVQPRKVIVRPLPRFNLNPDNDAQALWRKGENPNAVYRLPMAVDLMTISQRLHEIALSTETYIRPMTICDVRPVVELHIWGNPGQCRFALAEVEAWLEETLPKQSRKHFDRVKAHTDEKELKALSRLDSEARRQKFRQAIPRGVGHRYVIVLKL
jgi:hypothetical protein